MGPLSRVPFFFASVKVPQLGGVEKFQEMLFFSELVDIQQEFDVF